MDVHFDFTIPAFRLSDTFIVTETCLTKRFPAMDYSGFQASCHIKNLLPSNGNVFTEPFARNGPDISAHLGVVALQRFFTLQYYSYKETIEAVGRI
jgi:hypothetical protein